ncbi:MAG TPA: hypothetical protein VJ276_02375, partial [Thermoanaerobaculia bacterium]|nr:hypothetical protein [Thermoanaerobaculia bacterium]
MRSLALLVLLSLLAVPAFAADADLEMTIYPTSGARVQIGRPITYYVVVTNKGPGDAHNIKFKVTPPPQSRNTRVSPADSVVQCPNFECSYALLRPGETKSFGIDEHFDAVKMTVSTTMTVTATENDPNPADNTATVTTEIVEAPDLYTFLELPIATEAEGATSLTAHIYNDGIVPAHDVVLDIDFPAGTKVVGTRPPAGWECAASGARLTCRTAELPVRTSQPTLKIGIDVIAPPR